MALGTDTTFIPNKKSESSTAKINYILICYGDNEYHRLAACFVIKTLLLKLGEHLKDSKIIVVTDHPGFFNHASVEYLPITQSELTIWTFDGRYHFNVKNRGLHKALSVDATPFCYLDNDVFPTGNRFFSILTSLLSDPSNLGLFKKEHLISAATNRSSKIFRDTLGDKFYSLPSGYTYRLTDTSEMWGSAIIASASDKMPQILDDAFFLTERWIDQIESHTIEQFALVECAKLHGLEMIEVKKGTQHYSTSGRKHYAMQALNKHKRSLYSAEAENPNVLRPIFTTLRQKWIKNFRF